jgi:hypothetical protein
MMMMYYSPYDCIMLTIFLVSFSVFFQKPIPIYLKLFPVYFFAALVTGLREEWLNQHGKYNTGVANIWGIFEFSFYFFVLHEVIVNKKIKRIIFYLVVFFALLAFFNIFFIQHKVGFNPVNFTTGSLITVVACIYYFVELFQKAEAQSLSRLPAFWICSAILFTTVISFPMFALASFLQVPTKVNKTTQLLYKNIDAIVNITLLLTMILYAIGFFCRIRIRKSGE